MPESNDNTPYPLDDDFTLICIRNYLLLAPVERDEADLRIEIAEVIQPPSKMPFIAIPKPPYPLLDWTARREFQGRGTTEHEALRDCLVKIKGKATDEIFLKRGTA